jgi:hypothetical protein
MLRGLEQGDAGGRVPGRQAVFGEPDNKQHDYQQRYIKSPFLQCSQFSEALEHADGHEGEDGYDDQEPAAEDRSQRCHGRIGDCLEVVVYG